MLAGIAALAFSLAALAQHKSEWEIQQEEREWADAVPKLPAYPVADDLIEFVVSAADTFRFFIDRKSISVEQGGVVRYTVVARSPGGAETVNYEGIRCKAGLYRVYATGRNDRTWSVRTSAEWREIPLKVANRWHQALRREFFCPQNTPIFDVAEGVDALRRGGHPHKAFDAGNIR